MGALYDFRCPVCDSKRQEPEIPWMEFDRGLPLGCGLGYPYVCKAIYKDIRRGKLGDEANKALDDYKKAHEGDEQTIADLSAKNKAYETASLKSRVAHEVGLSYEWIGRISGDDEESIRKDAESLKKLVGNGAQPIPTKNTESGENVDSATASLKSVLNGIKQS